MGGNWTPTAGSVQLRACSPVAKGQRPASNLPPIELTQDGEAGQCLGFGTQSLRKKAEQEGPE